MTIRQLRTAQENGVSYNTFQMRVKRGWDPERAAALRVNPSGTHAKWGAVTAAARAAGIPRTTLSSRLCLGWTMEEAVSRPVGNRRARGAIAQAPRAEGVKLARVYKRLARGWTLERALNTPPKRAYRRAR